MVCISKSVFGHDKQGGKRIGKRLENGWGTYTLMIKGDFYRLFSYDYIEKYDFFLQTVWIL